MSKYASDQHELICELLGVSPSPDDPGDTALEAVVRLKQQLAHAESTCDAYAEAIDNVREVLGLKSTHYLVIHDEVRDALRVRAEQLAACRALLRESVRAIDGHLVDRTWEEGWIERAKEQCDGK